MRHFLLLFIFAALIPQPSALAAEDKNVVFLCHGEDRYLNQAATQIREELSAVAEGRYGFKWEGKGCGAWDTARAITNVQKALKKSKTDLIIAGGLPVIQGVMSAVKKNRLSKPVVLIDLLDTEAMGLPYDKVSGTSGEQNLYYLSRDQTAGEQIDLFQKIIPFQTLHVLLHPEYFSLGSKVIERRLADRNFKIKFLEYKTHVKEILAQVDAAQIEALMLTPSILNDEDYRLLLSGLNQRKIPTFSWMGYRDVEMGALIGSVPQFMTKLSRRIALQVDRILRGEQAGQLPVQFSMERKIVVNRATANQIGVDIPFDILMQAEILNADAVRGDQLNLFAAVEAALEHNYNFKIATEEINSASKDHLLQWTNYLPSVKFRLDYDIQDSESAAHAGSGEKQRFGYGISLNQLIFSDPVLRDIINAQKQVRVERLQYDTIVLDITDRTIRAYLQYLRTKALLKVEQENLKSTEANLRTAEQKYEAGTKGKDDVLRWQSERAETKADVIRRAQDVNQARVDLNQLMNRKLETEFKQEEVGLETVGTYFGSKALIDTIRDLKTFRHLMDYATQHAIEHSPELEALDIGIDQQKNLFHAAVGKHFLPEAALTGDLRHEIDDEVITASPNPNDHDDWEINLKMTYPLFDGGRRPIDSMKQRNELRRLKFKRELKAQQIEQDLRKAGYDVLHSIPAIELRQEAMISSTENYEIMAKKYEEGKATITDLVDAQTQKFSREANAVIAVYDFLEDLSRFDRQVTKFYMIADSAVQEQWLRSVRQYLNDKGV